MSSHMKTLASLDIKKVNSEVCQTHIKGFSYILQGVARGTVCAYSSKFHQMYFIQLFILKLSPPRFLLYDNLTLVYMNHCVVVTQLVYKWMLIYILWSFVNDYNYDKSNLCVHVCVCVCLCLRVCVCAHARACKCVHVCDHNPIFFSVRIM